ncbi:phosphotransferase [Nonomuraea sp. NPDC052634]|uniref:phosphotransferase family protein n=1 Tax=Nonomuraea sp. NPDC052634 TaxID=3155813 RepID=UPI0034241C6D
MCRWRRESGCVPSRRPRLAGGWLERVMRAKAAGVSEAEASSGAGPVGGGGGSVSSAGVAGGRRFAGRDRLAGLVREVFGPGTRLDGVERLRGGTRKGVYRLTFGRGPGAVLYSWAVEENFWGDEGGPSGLQTFLAAHQEFSALGVRVPRLLFADGSGRHYPGEVAVVEDVRGGTLEERLRRNDLRGLSPLAAYLETMAGRRSAGLGRVGQVEAGVCPDVVLGWAVKDLAEAAGRVEAIRRERDAFEELLREMAAGVEPRTEHALIHGELGPDHVLMDDGGEPVLIDIDGAKFFDVEWEHVFLRLRFGEHYPRLRIEGLDEARMRFYRLAQSLALVAGPLRLLDGDFPDREAMMAIVRHHIGQALGFVRGG